jgi:hypothetical protein
MTDEERQKLVARLRAHEVVMWTDIDLAADEIERLTKRLQAVHGYAEECEAKIAMQADQIDRMIIKKLVS